MSQLKADLKMGSNFTWGPIVKHYHLGPYDLIEHREFVYKNNVRTHRLSRKTAFSIYVHGRSTSLGATSLEAALVQAIAYKYDGCNSQAARYFLRGIGFWGRR